MKCNCRKEIGEQLKQAYPEAIDISGQYEMFSGKPFMEWSLTIEKDGKRKHKSTMTTLLYCPFCGQKCE